MSFDPQKYRLTGRVSREQIEAWAANPTRQIVLAIRTCWWSLYETAYMPYVIPGKHPLPCDPRSSPLVISSMAGCWAQAVGNPDFYGPHGIDAFVAAFQGNVVVAETGKPTSFDDWSHYNQLLDANTVVA